MDRRVSRRELLVGGGLGLIAVGLVACGATTPASTAPSMSADSSAPGSSVAPTASASGGLASAGPAASPTPSTSPSASGRAPTPPPISQAELRRLVASLLVVGFRGQTVGSTDWIVRAIKDPGLGGVILFDRDQLTGTRRNIASPPQLAALVRSLRAAAGSAGLIVSIDQEGGQVARLNPGDGYPASRSEAQVGAQDDPAAAAAWARSMADELAAARINLNFAPVVDLDVNPTSPAIGALGRSFSADPAVVTSLAGQEIRAHHAAGVRCAIKHFPGIGSSTGNTDAGFVDVTRTWRPVELGPFRSLVQAHAPDAVMVGHVLNGQLDASRPASLSHATVTNLLRQGIGWDGAVVSDDMQAGAIRARYGTTEAIGLAVEAGVDLLVFANQAVYDPGIVATAVDAIVALVGAGRVTVDQLRASADRRSRLLSGAM